MIKKEKKKFKQYYLESEDNDKRKKNPYKREKIDIEDIIDEENDIKDSFDKFSKE